MNNCLERQKSKTKTNVTILVMVKETFQFLNEKDNLIRFKKIPRTSINKTGRRKIVLKFVTYKEYPPIISKKLTIALEKSLLKSIILIC